MATENTGGGRERDRQRDRDRERERERQRQRETERDRERQRQRQRETERDRDRDRETQTKTDVEKIAKTKVGKSEIPATGEACKAVFAPAQAYEIESLTAMESADGTSVSALPRQQTQRLQHPVTNGYLYRVCVRPYVCVSACL